MTGSHTEHSIRFTVAAFLVAILALPLLATSASATSKSTVLERRDKIEKRAKSQRGTSYRSGGSSTSGFDCSGFTRWVFQKFGVSLPHQSGSQFDLGKRSSNKRIWKRGKLKPGDLVFQKTTSARVGHVGIYVGKGKMISSTSSSGVRVDSLYDSYWGPRWVGGTRLAVHDRWELAPTGSADTARPHTGTRTTCTDPIPRACCATDTRRSVRPERRPRDRMTPSP